MKTNVIKRKMLVRESSRFFQLPPFIYARDIIFLVDPDQDNLMLTNDGSQEVTLGRRNHRFFKYTLDYLRQYFLAHSIKGMVV